MDSDFPVKVTKIKLNTAEAFNKIKHWCAYQERSQWETKKKLRSFGLTLDEVNQIVAELISENFLNEERFAIAFAGGKFRMKGWGKNKIKTELKAHQISDYSINKALVLLQERDYQEKLEQILEKKNKQLKENNNLRKNQRLLQYAVSRGYDWQEVEKTLKKLNLWI